MIKLYFGNPYDEWSREMAEEIAVNHGLSMEDAVFAMIQRLLESFADSSDGHSFLDDRFGWTYERIVCAPKITTEQKTESGIKYSVMVLEDSYVTHRATGEKLPLTDRALTVFGEDFEDMFGIEYLGHKRVGLI